MDVEYFIEDIDLNVNVLEIDSREVLLVENLIFLVRICRECRRALGLRFFARIQLVDISREAAWAISRE